MLVTIHNGAFMQIATVEKAQTKILQSVEPTFQEWLAGEAAAGRMILATGNGERKLPAKPKETVDFWPIYNEARADRF